MTYFIVFCIFVVAIEFVENSTATFCDFHKMIAGKNVNATCRNITDGVKLTKLCTANCLVELETASPVEYECFTTSKHPEGKWWPDAVPHCYREYDRLELCNVSQLAEENHDIGWECEPHDFTDMTCKPYCKHTGAKLTPREYKCKAAKGVIGGNWIPTSPPRCNKGCDPDDFFASGISSKCDTKDGIHICNISCSGMFFRPPARYYMCIEKEISAEGLWSPNVPICFPKGCHMENFKKSNYLDRSCSQSYKSKVIHCSFTCKSEYHSTWPGLYACSVTEENPDGIWYPNNAPVCEIKSCNPPYFFGPAIKHACEKKDGIQICNISCSGMFYEPPAENYKCMETPEDPIGHWMPHQAPICFPRGCNIEHFTEGIDVSWNCTHGYTSTDIFCTFRCKSEYHTTWPGTYTCSVTKEYQDGMWNPNTAPVCKLKYCEPLDFFGWGITFTCEDQEGIKRCNISCSGTFDIPPPHNYKCIKTPNFPEGFWSPHHVPICFPKGCHMEEFTKGNDLNRTCIQENKNSDIQCTFRCKSEIYTTEGGIHVCGNTMENPDGMWNPDRAPVCKPNSCDPRHFFGPGINHTCENKDGIKRCNISCSGMFYRPPAHNYKCIVTSDYPRGFWSPGYVPICFPKGCHMYKFTYDDKLNRTCIQAHRDEPIMCVYKCKSDLYITKEIIYKCSVTTENPDGMWTPSIGPICTPKSCDPNNIFGPGIHHTCIHKANVTGTTCNISCNGIFDKPPAPYYKCIVTPEDPTGLWTPNQVPLCFPRGCHLETFTKGNDVSWSCYRRYALIFCNFTCKSELYTTGAGTYTCSVSKEFPFGIWHPYLVPVCEPKYKYSEMCNKDKLQERNYGIEWTCNETKLTQVTCKGYCRSTRKSITPHQICDMRSGVIGGRWLPKDLPICHKNFYDCDTGVFSIGLKNVSWSCTREKEDELICKPHCTVDREYLTELVDYRCKMDHYTVGGVWTPKNRPKCVKDTSYEQCNTTEFSKSEPHITWNCKNTTDYFNDITCKPYCNLTGNYLFPNEYSCAVTENVRGGVWNPATPPICEKACSFRKFARGKNAHASCTPIGDSNESVCSVKCDGMFETPPETNFSCISSPDHPEEENWTPNYFPDCNLKSCDFTRQTRGKNLVQWCDYKKDDTVRACQISCSGTFEFPPALEYTCDMTIKNVEGTWKPNKVPRCIPTVGKPLFDKDKDIVDKKTYKVYVVSKGKKKRDIESTETIFKSEDIIR